MSVPTKMLREMKEVVVSIAATPLTKEAHLFRLFDGLADYIGEAWEGVDPECTPMIRLFEALGMDHKTVPVDIGKKLGQDLKKLPRGTVSAQGKAESFQKLCTSLYPALSAMRGSRSGKEGAASKSEGDTPATLGAIEKLFEAHFKAFSERLSIVERQVEAGNKTEKGKFSLLMEEDSSSESDKEEKKDDSNKRAQEADSLSNPFVRAPEALAATTKRLTSGNRYQIQVKTTIFTGGTYNISPSIVKLCTHGGRVEHQVQQTQILHKALYCLIPVLSTDISAIQAVLERVTKAGKPLDRKNVKEACGTELEIDAFRRVALALVLQQTLQERGTLEEATEYAVRTTFGDMYMAIAKPYEQMVHDNVNDNFERRKKEEAAVTAPTHPNRQAAEHQRPGAPAALPLSAPSSPGNPNRRRPREDSPFVPYEETQYRRPPHRPFRGGGQRQGQVRQPFCDVCWQYGHFTRNCRVVERLRQNQSQDKPQQGEKN